MHEKLEKLEKNICFLKKKKKNFSTWKSKMKKIDFFFQRWRKIFLCNFFSSLIKVHENFFTLSSNYLCIIDISHCELWHNFQFPQKNFFSLLIQERKSAIFPAQTFFFSRPAIWKFFNFFFTFFVDNCRISRHN